MRLEYGGQEKGPSTTACIKDDHISLDVLPDIGIPKGTWTKNGWELIPLVRPPTVSFKSYALRKLSTFVSCSLPLKLQKTSLDNYKEGQLVPHFALALRLKNTTNPQPLEQQIAFTGLQHPTCLTLLREPRSIKEGVTDFLALLVVIKSVSMSLDSQREITGDPTVDEVPPTLSQL